MKPRRQELYPDPARGVLSESCRGAECTRAHQEKPGHAVAEASRSVSPQQCKVAVFANSKEYYGTDLMGMDWGQNAARRLRDRKSVV